MFQPYGNVVAAAMEEIDQAFDVIINSTSASLSGELPAISSQIFASHSSVYDMMYGQGKTTFNQWALEQGATCVYDGLGMLVGQAAESFMLWRGLRPGTKQILRELRKNPLEVFAQYRFDLEELAEALIEEEEFNPQGKIEVVN